MDAQKINFLFEFLNVWVGVEKMLGQSPNTLFLGSNYLVSEI